MKDNGRPLQPATCQSVKMGFLALSPGVHTIEALTLTDTDTQHALTLRYSIALFFVFFHIYQDFIVIFRTSLDVVVHEAPRSN